MSPPSLGFFSSFLQYLLLLEISLTCVCVCVSCVLCVLCVLCVCVYMCVCRARVMMFVFMVFDT